MQPELTRADRHSHPAGVSGIVWVLVLVLGLRGLRRMGSMPVKEDGVCEGLVRMLHHVHSWQCCVAWAEGTRGAMLATAHMVVMNVCL